MQGTLCSTPRESNPGRTNSPRVQTCLEKVWLGPWRAEKLAGVARLGLHFAVQVGSRHGCASGSLSAGGGRKSFPVHEIMGMGRVGMVGMVKGLGCCRRSHWSQGHLSTNDCGNHQGPCQEKADTSTGRRRSEPLICVGALVSMLSGPLKVYFQEEGLQNHRGTVLYACGWGRPYQKSPCPHPWPPVQAGNSRKPLPVQCPPCPLFESLRLCLL